MPYRTNRAVIQPNGRGGDVGRGRGVGSNRGVGVGRALIQNAAATTKLRSQTVADCQPLDRDSVASGHMENAKIRSVLGA